MAAHHVAHSRLPRRTGCCGGCGLAGLGSGFFRFLGAAALYNFGMTVFFLLYNLHLLKRGFHEDFLGAVTTALTVGSISGTLPAGLITSRFGLRPALLFRFWRRL